MGIGDIVNKKTVAIGTETVDKSPVQDYTRELGLKAAMVGRIYFQFSTDCKVWYAIQGTHTYMRISGDGKVWSPALLLDKLLLPVNMIGRAPVYDNFSQAPIMGVDTGLYVVGGVLYQYYDGQYNPISANNDEEPSLTEDIQAVGVEATLGWENGELFPAGMTFTEYATKQLRRANPVYYDLPEIESFQSNIVKVEVGSSIKPTLTLVYIDNDSAGVKIMRYTRDGSIVYEGGKKLSHYDSIGVSDVTWGNITYGVTINYLAPDIDKTNLLGEIDTTHKYQDGTMSKTLTISGDYKHIAVTKGFDPGIQNGEWFKVENQVEKWSDEDYILPLDGVAFVAILVPPSKTLDLNNTVNPAAMNDKLMANVRTTVSTIEVPVGGGKTAQYTLYRYMASTAYDGDENKLYVKFLNN